VEHGAFPRRDQGHGLDQLLSCPAVCEQWDHRHEGLVHGEENIGAGGGLGVEGEEGDLLLEVGLLLLSKKICAGGRIQNLIMSWWVVVRTKEIERLGTVPSFRGLCLRGGGDGGQDLAGPILQRTFMILS
jgi:hypothetical protein